MDFVGALDASFRQAYTAGQISAERKAPENFLNHLLPTDARLEEGGELWLGGCAASALARDHGTPLYVFSEETLREAARIYQQALRKHYPNSAQTAYASKAFLCLAVARLFDDEGLDLDVASGGELSVALRAGFPAGRIHFHGNNKTPAELAEALAAGVGRIAVDNFHELEEIARLVHASGRAPAPIWLRLAPGVEAHTHSHIQTGQEDTKFGFSIASGQAERAIATALRMPQVSLLGLHAHIGSQILDPESLAASAERLVGFAAAMRDRYGFELSELSPGGGWGVPMLDSDPAAPIEPYVAMLARAVISACRAAGLPLPHLVLEPGRSLIARAGMALYTVGARKEIPGVHTYVAIDGGMADNIRPALYGARYTAFLVNPSDPPLLRSRETVSIAGKYCESGDVLIHDVTLPAPRAGDLLAIPMVGAYTLAMASNYNLALRPAVVMVSRGRAREIQRRERYDDLLRREESLAPARRFRKYQALGNDYIVLDRRDWPASPRPDTVRRICDRHRGVGADGVLWGPLPAPGGAYGLRLFNPDGAEFEVSGNGVRIFARYLLDQHLAAGPEFTIVTPAARIHACALDGRGEHIALQMGYLQFDEQPIVLNVAGVAVCGVAVNIGNPHCVVFLSDQPAELLRKYHAEGEPTPALAQALGPVIEHDPRFPNQTNVQFAQPLDPHTLRIEIWERGAGYTLASGTSSCAAAGAAIRRGDCANPVSVQMPGGEMLVEVDEHGSVTLTGPVEFAFEGEFAGDIAEI